MRTRNIRLKPSVVRVLISLLFFLSGSISMCYGQTNSEVGLPPISSFSAKDYNAHQQNWDIVQDTSGIIYFANALGLVEYDGVSWNLTADEKVNGVRSLDIDDQNRIFIGASAEIGYFERDESYQLQYTSLMEYILEEDKQFNDVWTVYCTDRGVYFMAREAIFLFIHSDGNDEREWDVTVLRPSESFMYSFYLDDTYFVHERGLGLSKLNEDKLVKVPGSEVLANDRLNVMLPFHNESSTPENKRKYLLGQFSDGFYILEGNSIYPFETELDEFVKDFFLYKGIKYKNDVFILSTIGAGIVMMNQEGEIIQKVDKSLGLNDNTIYSFHIDKNEILWIGMDNGISKFELGSPLTLLGENYGITSSILSLIRYDGLLYLGTSNGLYRQNAASGRFEQVSELPYRQIFDLAEVDNELIIPSDGLYALRNDQFHVIRQSTAGEFEVTTVLHSKKHPDYMFVGLQNGIGILNRKGTFSSGQSWEYVGTIPGTSDIIWKIAESTEGIIWTGTQTSKVISISNLNFEDVDNLFTNVDVRYYDSSDGLSDFNTVPFRIGDKVIFASSRGIFQFLPEDDRFIVDSTFTKSTNGITSGGDATEYTLEVDQLDRIWMNLGKETVLAIPNGDGNYEISKKPFKSFSEDSAIDILTEKDGITWFATFEGLVRYDEKIEKNYNVEFSAIIKNVNSGDQNLPFMGKNEGGQSLDYLNNSLVFGYSAPFYEQEQRTVFQTYLEGFNKTWSGWNKLAQKEYTSLPEGKYTFHVRAKNIYDQISEEAVYHFRILPPLHRTWWAYLLYGILAVGIIYTLMRWRTSQLNARSLALQREVEDRTKEIKERVEELSVINGVQKGLVEKMDIDSIYTLIGDQLCKLFDANTFVIRTFDTEEEIEIFNYAVEKGERLDIADRPLDSFARHLLQSNESILIQTGFREFIQQFSEEESLEGEIPKAAVFAPMIVNKKVIGNVSLQNVDHENAFSENDVRLLGTLVNSMTVALENVRLFNQANQLLLEAEQRAEELAVINKVQEGLVKQTKMEEIFKFVGVSLQNIVDAESIVISTFDHEAGVEYFNYASRGGSPYQISPRPFDDFTRHIFNQKKPLVVNENFRDFIEEFLKGSEENWDFPKSAIFMPITRANKVVGNVSLQNLDKENAYSQSEIRMLETLVNSISIAIENARLFEETQLRAAEMSTVNSVTRALASNLDLKNLFIVIGDKMQELFQADIVYIAMLDSNTDMISFPYQYGDELKPMVYGEGLTSNIIKNRRSQLINKDVEKKHTELGIERIGIAATSYLGVPIFSGDDVLGVLSVQSTKEVNRFSDSDMHLLEIIAANVGVAINNAQLYDQAGKAMALAEEANEAKSAFLSTVSHELRTPLTSVLGFAKIIKKRLEDRIFPLITSEDPRIQKTVRQVSENLNVVVSEGQRLTKLINDVLDLAKIEAGKTDWNMEDILIQEVVERAITATTSLFEGKEIHLIKKIDDSLPSIIGDSDKLIQVVINLLSNAVKFTDEGTVECHVRQEGNELLVSIIDSGIGISDEDLPKVFEKFKQVGDTLTDKPKGTGLGLPISVEIVEHHGGRIWVESEVNKGSTFTFSLPMAIDKKPTNEIFKLDSLILEIEKKFAPANSSGHIPGKSILIVDDEQNIRELLSQELIHAGYKVHTENNGKKALDWIRNHNADLIILDVMMPEMNGFDAAAILKNDPKTSQIPIIILSIVEDKKRGYDIGVDRYLTKPIDIDKLFHSISSLLDKGQFKRKVMIVDENPSSVNSLVKVLMEKGYDAIEVIESEFIDKAIADKPDLIIIKIKSAEDHEKFKSLQLQKGIENIPFLVYE